jgi:hypothetical protein
MIEFVDAKIEAKVKSYLAALSSSTARNTNNLNHLNLAGPIAHGESDISPLEYLDLANFQDGLIKIPLGERTLLKKTTLKSFGDDNAFVLFPNLPLEIRRKIYHSAVTGQEIEVKVIETGSGQWIGQSYPNLELIAASHEACQYLCAEYGHLPIVQGGSTLYSPKLDGFLSLIIVGATQHPVLQIQPKFSVNFDLAKINSLTFEINYLHYDNAAKWVQSNLVGFPNISKLNIRCYNKISTPAQQKATFRIDAELKKGASRASGYNFILRTEDGRGFQDWSAMDRAGELVVKQTEHQGILDLWMMLDRGLKNMKKFPTFPSEVAMQFYWTA